MGTIGHEYGGISNLAIVYLYRLVLNVFFFRHITKYRILSSSMHLWYPFTIAQSSLSFVRSFFFFFFERYESLWNTESEMLSEVHCNLHSRRGFINYTEQRWKAQIDFVVPLFRPSLYVVFRVLNWYYWNSFSRRRARARACVHYVPTGLRSTEYGCDGISNLPASPRRVLSYRVHVIIGIDRRGVDRLIFGLSRRSISMRIIDCHTNSIARPRSRPCKFCREPAAQPDMQIHREGGNKKKKGTADTCDCSTRLGTHYGLWITIVPWIPFFYTRLVNREPCAPLCPSILELFNDIGPLWFINPSMFIKLRLFCPRSYISVFSN